jgi:hypothetical protein
MLAAEMCAGSNLHTYATWKAKKRRMFLGKLIGRVDEVSELLAPVHQMF